MGKERKKFLSDVPRPDMEIMERFYGHTEEREVSGQPDTVTDLQSAVSGQPDNLSQLLQLPLSEIEPDPEQPRKVFDETSIEELAASLEQHGQLQPILVRKIIGAPYVIVAGERRWRACNRLGRPTIEARVIELDAQHAFELALAENIQRESLLPFDEAHAYAKLMRERALSQAEVSRLVGVDRRRISEKLSLLRLPESVQALLSGQPDKLTEAHALVLLSAPAGTDIVRLAERCVAHGWSVAHLRKVIHRDGTFLLAPTVFQKIRMQMNRRGGFTLMVRARSQDEVTSALEEMEKVAAELRGAFLSSQSSQEETIPPEESVSG